MKRRNFLGLAGQSVALVAAAPALVPLATAAPTTRYHNVLAGIDSARRTAKARALGAGYGANPSLIVTRDGRRAMVRAAAKAMNEASEDDVYHQFKMSTPFDLSTAIEVEE